MSPIYEMEFHTFIVLMTSTQYYFCVIQLCWESKKTAIITLKHHCLDVEKAAETAWHGTTKHSKS